jgi:starvation-inducible DNA-binding protein
MTSTARPTHLPALDRHQQEQVGHELQATLVDLVDLSLLGKQLHWSVVGPHFRSLHLQLDELVGRVRELADTVAERAVAIGYWPDGQAGAITASDDHETLGRGAIDDRDVVRELTHFLEGASGRARERMDRLGELDLASQDVLIEVVRELEQQLWMIRVQVSNSASS